MTASGSESRLAAAVGTIRVRAQHRAAPIRSSSARRMARSVVVVFLMLGSLACLDAIQRECLFLLSWS